MDGTGKNAAQHNPQVGGRTELCAHDGSENGTRAGDVKKLNHKYLPIGKNDEVNTVGFGHGGGNTVVGTENPLYETTVKQIAQHKSYEA